MKISILTHNYPSNPKDRQNAGVFVYDFAQKLLRVASVSVFCPSDNKNVNEKVGNVRVYWFKRGSSKKLGDLKLSNPLNVLSLLYFFSNGIVNLCKFLTTEKPDVQLSMWAWPSGLFAYLGKKIYKIPYAIWALGSDINVYAKVPGISFLMRKILQSADYLFADGIQLSRDVSKISGKKCIFLPSATDMIAFRKKKKKNDKITITFLGRMEDVKGPDLLIHALLDIGESVGDYKVNMIGGGSLLTKLKRVSKKNGLSKNVKFWGNVRDVKKIASILFDSDWVVIPSRGDSIPLVFSESIKNSTPVICSDLKDLSYVVRKYKVGILFRAGSKDELAKVLKNLTKLRKIHGSFTSNTKDAAEYFSIDKSVDRLYNCLA